MIIFRRKHHPSSLGYGAEHPVVVAESKEAKGEGDYDYSTTGGIRDAWMAGVIDDATAVAYLVETGIPEETARLFVRQWIGEGTRTRVAMSHTAVPFEQIDVTEEGVPKTSEDAVNVPAGSIILISETTYDTAELAKDYAFNIWAAEYMTANPDSQVTECGGMRSPKVEGKYVAYLIITPIAKAPEEEKTNYWPWVVGGIGVAAVTIGGLIWYGTKKKGKRR